MCRILYFYIRENSSIHNLKTTVYLLLFVVVPLIIRKVSLIPLRLVLLYIFWGIYKLNIYIYFYTY